MNILQNTEEIGGIFHGSPDALGSAQPWRPRRNSPSSPERIRNDRLCFSGRTALALILDDALDYGVQNCLERKPIAYVPSYCCESMLLPFIDAGFDLAHYPVELAVDGGIRMNVDFEFNCEVFLAVSYFGIHSAGVDDAIYEFKARGVVTIEDRTHRLLSSLSNLRSDYTFASVRKWLPMSTGGMLRKQGGTIATVLRPPGKAAEIGWEAMRLKDAYLSGKDSSLQKSRFLELVAWQGRLMASDYRHMDVDVDSLRAFNTADLEAIRMRRRANAKVLVEELRRLASPILQFADFDANRDTPLYLPIFVPAEIRDSLVDHLRNNSIYVPVHWPMPRQLRLGAPETFLYQSEISLVCDQRYGTQEMLRIVECIREALT